MREIRQKGIYTFIHSFHESWDRCRRNKNKKNLGGKIEQSSDEEVQEESVGELLPGESNDVDETFHENFKPTCQERASPYMMKAVVNQLKYLQGKLTKKNKTKDLEKLKKPTIERQRANSHHSTPPAVLYFFKLVYFLAYKTQQFGPYWLFCRKFKHFYAYFLQALIMRWHTKNEKYSVWKWKLKK